MSNANLITNLPFAKILIPFISGTLIGFHFNPANSTSIILIIFFLLLALLFSKFSLFRKSFVYYKIIAFQLYVTLLLAGMFNAGEHISNPCQNILENNKITYYRGQVTTPFVFKNEYYRGSIYLTAYKDTTGWKKCNCKANIMLANDGVDNISYALHEDLIFKGRIQAIENYGNPDEFNYKRYLAGQAIYGQFFVKPVDIILSLPANTEGKLLNINILRYNLLDNISAAPLSNESRAFLKAILFGYRSDLGLEDKSTFVKAGIMHLIAVSGMHVGIVYLMLASLFSILPFAKTKLKIPVQVAILLFLWLYCGLAGFSPSVTRTAIMFSLFAVGKMAGWQRISINHLFAAAFIILLINPYNIYMAGFYLSFFAVAGILILYRPIYNLLYIKNSALDKVWGLICVSIAAQTFTFPLILFYFNGFPILSLVLGVFLTPIVVCMFYLALPYVFLSGIDLFDSLVVPALDFLVQIFYQSSRFTSSIQWSYISDVFIDQVQVVLIFLMLFSFLALMFYKLKQYLIQTLVFTVLFAFYSNILYFKKFRQDNVIVFNIPGKSVIAHLGMNKNILYTSAEKESLYMIQKHVSKHQYQMNQDIDVPLIPIYAGKNKLLWIKGPSVSLNDKMKYYCNKIIISQEGITDLDLMYTVFSPSQIVLDATNSYYYFLKVKQWALDKGISLHYVKEDGHYKLYNSSNIYL